MIRILTLSFVFIVISYQIENQYLRKLNAPQVLKGSGKSVYYIDEQDIRHHIPDWGTFISMGLDANQIRSVSDSELFSYVEGKPLGVIESEVEKKPGSMCPCNTSREVIRNDEIINRKHIICLLDTIQNNELFKELSDHIDFKIISIQDSKNLTKLYDDGCDILANTEILSHQSHTDKLRLSCPGTCSSIPTMVIPINLITSGANIILTCSLTLNEALSHSGIQNKTDPGVKIRLISFVIRAMAQRRFEECKEKEFWPNPSWVHHHKNPNANEHDHIKVDAGLFGHRRRIGGLIIWIGSLNRFDVGISQQRILALQNITAEHTNSKDWESEIVGWLATDAVYSCRVGATLCEDLINGGDHYYGHMPSTKLHLSEPGWACAQRRPLRSLSHLLLLFDPGFVLVVDDDTFVSLKLLLPGTPLSTFIHSYLATNNVVMGELTMGRKITKKGFFYGGSGYLIGRAALERLVSHRVLGPPATDDTVRNGDQMRALGILDQALTRVRLHCTDTQCVALDNATMYATEHTNENANEYVGMIAHSAVRLVDLCTNLMSEEKTCFHSDHAMSRCLVHASYSFVINTFCGGTRLPGASWGNTLVGMCMGVEQCDPEVQITCHRWMPSAYNLTVPVVINGPGGREDQHQSLEQIINASFINLR